MDNPICQSHPPEKASSTGRLASVPWTLIVYLLCLICLGILAWYLLLGMSSAPIVDQVENRFLSWLMHDLMQLATAPRQMMSYLYLSSLMWLVMMIAMMTPAVIPITILHVANTRRPAQKHDTLFLILGYLLSWVVYGLMCAVLQVLAANLELIQGMQLQTTVKISAIIFIICGVYQFTPLKQSCLRL